MPKKAPTATPVTHHDQDGAQRQDLSDFYADVEGQQVGQKAVTGDLVVLDLGGQAEPMKEPKNEGRNLGVGLNSEPPLERAQVVQGLVDDGQRNDGVHQVGIGRDAEVHTGQQGDRVPNGKQTDIDRYVLDLVQEEDHPEQEKQVVVTSDHVLGPQVDEGEQVHTGDFLDIALVAFGNTMCKNASAKKQKQTQADP